MFVYHSGLIVDPNIKICIQDSSLKTCLSKDIPNSKRLIRKKFKKIKKLPAEIQEKILEVPQFKIFFENGIPYYTTQYDLSKKELPKINGDTLYYDPVKDTEAYKLVIDNVKKLAENEYEKFMLKNYGMKQILGGVHFYYDIEAAILYELYGIYCVNNPMSLNSDFRIF